MSDNADDGNNNKTLIGITLALSILLLAWLIAELLDSKSGEQAAALGAIVGGIVGAGGAILAVYLTLSRQRRDDTAKVRAAVRTEISTYSKYLIGALDICKQIASGAIVVPMAHATYIAKNLVDPVIYPSIADRVSLLKRPQATVEFYMRVQEAKAMAEGFAASAANLTQGQSGMTNVQPSHAASIADSLITALQLARPIVADNDGVSSELDIWIRDVVQRDIDRALQSAQIAFPKAESFRRPPSS